MRKKVSLNECSRRQSHDFQKKRQHPPSNEEEEEEEKKEEENINECSRRQSHDFQKKRRYPPSNEKEEEEEEEESISRRMFEEEAVWRKRKREGMGCPRKVAKRERARFGTDVPIEKSGWSVR